MKYTENNKMIFSSDDNMKIDILDNNNTNQQKELKCTTITNILDSIYNDDNTENSINHKHNLISHWNSWHTGSDINKIKKKYKVLDTTLQLFETKLIDTLNITENIQSTVGGITVSGCCSDDIIDKKSLTTNNKLYKMLEKVKREMKNTIIDYNISFNNNIFNKFK